MEEKKNNKDRLIEIPFLWRNRQMKTEISSNCNVKELGMKLVQMCNVKPDTLKLLIPLSTKRGSKLVIPFSAEHSSINLQEMIISEGKFIKMMGVSENELMEVTQNLNKDLRIIGFDEEAKRLQNRKLVEPQASLKLPQGKYIFCDFRTLHIPGVQLNPPPSEALKRMHMLACDPGIIAIMNKYQWRVGIMSEMAPVGYVGISPKCILGVNKNYGEEISLRLRTDDFKGLRKYESIKKTLLHELAHMVYSDHDANFFALNKQLNEEVEILDWTKSKGHTLSGSKPYFHEDKYIQSSYHNSGKKIGGTTLPSSARASSVAAAYGRHFATSTLSAEETKIDAQKSTIEREPDPDDNITKMENNPTNILDENINFVERKKYDMEPDINDDDMIMEDGMQANLPKYVADSMQANLRDEALEMHDYAARAGTSNEMMVSCEEPDPDTSLCDKVRLPCKEINLNEYESESNRKFHAIATELHPDDAGSGSVENETQMEHFFPGKFRKERELHECKTKVESVLHHKVSNEIMISYEESDPVESLGVQARPSCKEPDPDEYESENEEIQRIENSVDFVCKRLKKAIEKLRYESSLMESTSSLQTLFKIIKNVIDHPDDIKFRRIRKGNHSFTRNVVKHKAAMEILTMVGFCEDVVTDGDGRSEIYMVLKRNDPGLLWLAKSTLESVA